GTDAAGNVYLADGLNSRIQKFTSSGGFIAAWGKGVNGGGAFGICTVASSCQAGSTGGLGGEMGTPQGVGTDRAGNVYATDGNARIQKFDASGNWIRAWGRNVIQPGKPGDLGDVAEICTVAADCQTGSTGGLGGEISGPRAVASDTAGNIYVDEADNNRSQQLNDTARVIAACG